MKNQERFAELEFCLNTYFDSHLAPVMAATRKELQQRQLKELSDYQQSSRGVLAGLAANAAGNIAYNPMDTLKMTGEWNSKTAEDYVAMCGERLSKNSALTGDLNALAAEWRTAAVAEVGRERYDALSEQLGCDLAVGYVEYRMQELMVQRMAKEQMPQSTMEYIIRKGAEGSLFGLGTEMTKSPLQHEIDQRAEKAYNPTKREQGLGRALAFGADLATTGGVSSWASLATMAGCEVVMAGIEQRKENEATRKKTLTVEECISRGVFGSRDNLFDRFRQRSTTIRSYDNSYVQQVNRGLKQKMLIATTPPKAVDWGKMDYTFPTLKRTEPRNAAVPLVIRPGMEQEYLESVGMHHGTSAAYTAQPDALSSPTVENNPSPTVENTQQNDATSVQEGANPTNTDGWSTLLATLGLNGISDIGANLGTVIAMLPDMLLGMLTGKTQSVNMKKDWLPMASIVIGMFAKNPLLKLLLVGMGGANLMNKMGHEAIQSVGMRHGASAGADSYASTVTTQYKHYDDEALNPRMEHPTLQGNLLVVTMDGVPCSITLPDKVVDAYRQGALPLNTLANAVLAKSDEQTSAQQVASRRMQQSMESDGRKTALR